MPSQAADGSPCNPWSPEARRWDLESAIFRWGGMPLPQAAERFKSSEVWRTWCADNTRAEFHEPLELWAFNDTVKHSVLLAALRESNL